MDEDSAHGSEGTMMAEPDRYAGVHPDLAEAVRAAPSFVVSADTLPLVRAALVERRMEAAATPVPDTTCEEIEIPARKGHPAVRALIYRREDHPADAPVLLSLHGGGFVLGHAGISDRANREWARDTAVTVVSIDYRLAPEHPYPAAIEDAWTALLWIAVQHGRWDTGRILVKGDSAGGGLAAGLALLARDRGGVAIAGQVLIYPMLDDRTRAEPDRAGPDGTLVWPCPSNQFAWASYLGETDGEIAHYAAPARAGDLRSLPPAFIGTGTLDLFYRENLDYARRLAEAGVPVAVRVADGAFHGFDTLAPDSAVSRSFTAAAMAALPFLLAR